jgi:hypothetical protein
MIGIKNLDMLENPFKIFNILSFSLILISFSKFLYVIFGFDESQV